MASCGKLKERYVEELENRKAIFLARVWGREPRELREPRERNPSRL